MILFFAALSQKRPLYKRDFLNVCCEPQGAQITYSYDVKWVASSLQQVTDASPLNDQTGLVVFTEIIEADNRFVFHPVRLVTVKRHLQEESSATFVLELSHFVQYSSELSARNAFLTSFAKYVERSPDRPHPQATHQPSKYVRVETTKCEELRGGEAWSPVVAHLRELNGLRDATFIIPQKGGSTTAPSTLFDGCQYNDGRAEYSIQAGSTRNVMAQMILGKDAVFQPPELVVKDAVASVTGPFVRQRSQGFEATFIVSFRRSFQQETSIMTLRLPVPEPVAPAKDVTFLSPEHQAVISLKISRRLLTITILLLVSGSFFMSVGPDLVAKTPLVNYSGEITLLSKLLGVAGLAVGSFLGFQKLPFK